MSREKVKIASRFIHADVARGNRLTVVSEADVKLVQSWFSAQGVGCGAVVPDLVRLQPCPM
jgi:hypothetical protein